MPNTDVRDFSERTVLRSDNGSEIDFQGRLYSESSYYDEENATLTKMRLFLNGNGGQVYSIVSGTGAEKTRRHYSVNQKDEFYEISNGVHTLLLPLDMLFAAVFGLCGIDPARAEELKPGFEENLRFMAG